VVKGTMDNKPIVYKIAHRLIGVDDNMNEMYNTELVLNNAKHLRKYLATNYPNDRKSPAFPYVIRQEYVTPIHELSGVKNSDRQKEGVASLQFILEEAYEDYIELINALGEHFILQDVWLKSPFQFGINRATKNLVLLDHGYLVPKKRSKIKCPHCGTGELEYSPYKPTGNFSKDLANLRELSGESYKCTNSSCKISKIGISPATIIESVVDR
jgi:hypothetical protein